MPYAKAQNNLHCFSTNHTMGYMVFRRIAKLCQLLHSLFASNCNKSLTSRP